MKPNVKDVARWTKYQDDKEYNISVKQYEKHILHAGEIELSIRNALEETAVNEEKYEEQYSRYGTVLNSQWWREKSLLSQMKYGKDV